MTVFANRIRTKYLRRRNKRQLLAALIMLTVFLAPYVIVAKIDRPTGFENLVPANRLCVVSWADSVPVYLGGE